eukprot:scaffold7.g3436.t1
MGHHPTSISAAGGSRQWRAFTPQRSGRRRRPAAPAARHPPAPASTTGPEAQRSFPSPLAAVQDALTGARGHLAAAALAAVLVAGLPRAAAAVTNEQLLFLEAWRAVDRAYVDKGFNGQSWFRARESYLKQQPMRSREETSVVGRAGTHVCRTLLASLDDPFTRFLDPDQRATVGSLTGVGVEVSFTPSGGGGGGGAHRLVVVAPTPGGPAEQAGVRPGDAILEIDGRPTTDLSLYAAGALLQGPTGSEVALRVAPAHGGPPRELRLVRTPITINPVDSALCAGAGRVAGEAAAGDKLGYIRIATFSKQTADKVREAIAQLQRGGAQRYVLDLRNNGGGVFQAGVEVGRMWMNEGEIVLIADSEGVRDVYEAQGSALELGAPLALIVNRGTASASEVLAGALRDGRGASVAGERTFGKGIIQTLVQLSDGSALAVTVARYQTPSGADINKVGIAPDLPLPEEQLAAIPATGQDFCKYVQAGSAPRLFK